MKIFVALSCSLCLMLISSSIVQGQEAVAEAIAESVEVAGVPIEKVKDVVRPLTVVVELNGNANRIAGTLVDSTQLSMKTSFGEASIPMSEIAGVRLPYGDDVSTTVIMLNGDSITGAVDIKQITVETEWGTANVKGSSIQSILFVPNVQWQASNNLSGKRWMLVDVKPSNVPTQAGNNAASNLSAPSQTRPTNPGNMSPSYRNGNP